MYNERTLWYRNNLTRIKAVYKITIIVALAFFVIFTFRNRYTLLSLTPYQIFLIIAFPAAAAWYRFAPPFFRLKKIRQTGWIKPFIIGLTWMGCVTIYPLLTRHLQTGELKPASVIPTVLLCILNFLFFFINAVIFDIKDVQIDRYHHLRTFPVILGIKNTFRFIILPAAVLYAGTFLMFQQQQHFTALQTTIQLIPYLLLVYTIFTYKQSRNVLYYLVAVDGLVFVKAVCGITSILFLKK
jgi:4-hydroxybenzoate polyprenyltransferase